jgi:hypothetical protein
MGFGIGILMAASIGCSFGYVLGAIMRMSKQADTMEQNGQSAQFNSLSGEPELPFAPKKSAA